MIHLKPAQFESRRGGERGITMLEVTLLLAAFAIVTAAVAPAVLRTLSEANARNVMQEMEALHVSVLGDTDGDTFGNPGFANNTCPDDNCPVLSNAGQEDMDMDGAGDLCDACIHLAKARNSGP